MDKVSEQRIALLHPKIREEVKSLVLECDKALTGRAKIRITQGLRTKAEQDALYAQGRTKPGKIVTNAKFGQSFHCYGLSFDFCLLIDGKEVSWDTKKDWDGDGISDWMEVVKIFVNAGFVWGGTFKKIMDTPHFEKTFSYSWRELLEKYNKKDFIPGTSYVNI